MQKKQTHMMYGFLTGLAMIILNVILYIAGYGFRPWAQWISYIPFLIGLILNAQAYAKENEHFVTYKNVWSSCFKASAIITIVMMVWGIISLYVFPEMKDKIFEMARQKLVEANLSDEQIDTQIALTKKLFFPFMIAGILFGTMIFGAIFSAIAAAIPKKKGEEFPPVMP